ncbi:MAG: hypothetical protein CMJ69_12930 [Planctomycetaceae bacterium]|nr:hypothetical protein [Planctomycetaceae bacterium]
MGWELLNTPMLWGLAGLALPLLAHLLTRKRFERVRWAAMQFLELERDARRRVRIEELQLILLRMLLVGLLVMALSRPAGSDGWLSEFLGEVETSRRDVVIVIDGSSSMGWRDGHQTPHAAAIQFAHRFLEDLGPGDSVAVIESRTGIRGIVDPPTVNHDIVRAALGRLPAPSGPADLPAAIRHAVALLRDTGNLRREVLVLTDGQDEGWRSEDTVLWDRLDDQLAGFPDAIRPVIRVATPGEPRDTSSPHFHVDPLDISRELVPLGLPISVRTTVHGHGNSDMATRRVGLEVDGQRLPDRTLSVSVPPDGEAAVEFSYRLPAAGSHHLSVVLDDDPLPGDNRADAVVTAVDALPVLLVDGAPHPDETRSETFFARAALSASSNQQPWIAGRVVGWDRLTVDDFPTTGVIVLANVAHPDPAWEHPLAEFVSSGGGLLITLGDRTDPAAWSQWATDTGLLPAVIGDRGETSGGMPVIRADGESLASSWMARFGSDRQGGFTEASFTGWWKMTPVEGPDPPRITAKLSNGDPLLVVGRRERGHIATWASTLDADWNTLPARPDYVSFLHELLFHLAGGQSARTVPPGAPLLLPVADDFRDDRFVMVGPEGLRFDIETVGGSPGRLARLADTQLPGHYALVPRQVTADGPGPAEHFVVTMDPRESTLDRLDQATRGRLAAGGRLDFVADQDELREAIDESAPRSEIWYLVLLLFLGLLLGEVVMTRRMVRGGYRQEASTS